MDEMPKNMASARAQSMKCYGTGRAGIVYAPRNIGLWTASMKLDSIERHGRQSYIGHCKQRGRYGSMGKRGEQRKVGKTKRE
jgi:hypothetical protein